MAKQRLIFYSAISLFLGIGLANFSFSLWWMILLWGIYVLSFFRYLLSHRLLIFLTLASGMFGIGYFHAYGLWQDKSQILPTQESEFRVVVSGEKKFSEKTQIVEVYFLSPYRGTAQLLTTPLVDLNYGDNITMSGQVEINNWPEKNIILFPNIKNIDDTSSSLMRSVIRTKEGWLERLNLIFVSDQASLLGGILFGARADFSASLREALKKSGTIHLVALSGYNISILILAINQIFRFYIPRKLFLIAVALLVLLFVIMVGGDASIVRAAIMGMLALVAKEFGRLYSIFDSILYAALGMSLWDPSLIGSDLGFQLSFVSLLGIVYLGPIFAIYLNVDNKNSSFLGWRESLSTTLAAQCAVLPILLGNFGSISLSSLPANVLILWIVPFVMGLGFAMILLQSLLFYLGIIIQPILHLLLSYMLGIINLAASLPMVAIPWNQGATIFYYAISIYIIYRHNVYSKIVS